MANKHTDSFSNYSTLAQLLAKWAGATSGSPAVGGTYAIGAASQGLHLPFFAAISVPLTAYAGHYFYGLRIKWIAANLTSTPMMSFTDNAGGLIGVFFNGSGNAILKYNSTVLNTSSLTVTAGSTHYYELDVQVGSSGSAKLYVDGVLFCTFTGSLGSTPFTIGLASVTSGQGEIYVADAYINDDTGSICNTRQGDTTVNTYRMVTAGTYAQFNRGGVDTGTNVGQLNKALADPASYNVSNVVNNRDSFKAATVPAPSVGLLGARLWALGRKDAFGSRQIALTQISGSADFTGASQLLSGTTDAWMTEDMSIDKNTSALWASVTPLNLAEWGYKITA